MHSSLMPLALFKKIIRWLIASSYAAFIYYLSSRTSFDLHSSFFAADKVGHLVLYLFFGFIVHWALLATRFRTHRHLAVISVVLVALYGLTDEFHQFFVPGREASFWDWGADVLGGVIGVRLAIFAATCWHRFFPDRMQR